LYRKEHSSTPRKSRPRPEQTLRPGCAGIEHADILHKTDEKQTTPQ
jgi:hypothetical protein